ncbi:potassium voltage-gated channel subfamily A member 2-like isoform X2 [Hydractinia symbiolongicarpus]|nr:potassium voltage-gated channel subfamily A member 2-like isoform X2 [Hydractinia symbiolongicarpus]
MFGAHKQYLNTHNGFKDIYLGKSSTLVIMVARGRISLPQNLYRAITKSWVLLYLMFIYTLLSAFIIWFVEVWRNKSNFPSSFITGFANGIWWSTITMSTVGYGDIVPKSLLGRLLSIMWIWLSVLLIACMTSTITNSLSLPINLEEEKVAVLNNSWEHQVIKKIPEEISVEETYEDVLNKVSKDDYVGLMDYTRASRTQEEIREKNIRLLSSFSGQFDWVFQLSHNRTNVSVVEDCLERIGRHDIKTIFAEYTSVITYNKLDDGIESLETNTSFFMSLCIGGIFLLGCMYDIVRYILKKTKKRTAELNLNQSSALKLELAQIHLKKRIISLREELNDNLTELENMLDEIAIK